LFNLILKSLDVYHSEVDLEIGYLIHCSLMLMDKAMYDSAYKFLKKAKTLAKENSKLSYLNKILHHELQLLRYDVPVKNEWHREELYKERTDSANQILYVVELQNLNDQMLLEFNRSFGYGKKQALKNAEKLIKHDLMKFDPAKLSIYAQVEFWSIKMFYHSIRNEAQQQLKCSLSMIKVLNKYWSVLNTRSKIMILQNNCNTCIRCNKIDMAIETLNKLKAIQPIVVGDNIAILQFVRLNELNIYLRIGQFEKSKVVIENLEVELKKYYDKIQNDYKAFLSRVIAHTYFANGFYKEAQKWINLILNSKTSSFPYTVISAMKLIEMLIFFETGKFDLFDSKLRSFERQCNKRKETHRHELLVANNLRLLLKYSKSDNFTEALKKFRTDLTEHFKKSPQDKNCFYDFNMLQWLESKITGVPMSQIISAG